MTGSVAIVLAFAVFPASPQDEAAGMKGELQALVRATTLLVESLERQEARQLADRDLLEVQIAVQLLDIRVRQQESLREGLESIDNREQALPGYIAATEMRLENLKKQLAGAVDEAKRLELQAQYDERSVYLTNQRNELEYLARRRAVLQTQLADGERSVLDIEDMVQAWIAEARRSTPGNQGR